MKYILIILLFVTPLLVGQDLRLVAGFYDNRMPRSIYTYREFEDKIELKLSTEYYDSGQKSYEVNYKDGLRSKKAWWYDNGNKKKEGTYKDGKEDGLWAIWYESGQKKMEAILKDGELISDKCWDEDGNKIECN